MKNYLILAMILIAGMTAYPQATRSARETKTEKGSTKKEATHRSATTRSDSKSKQSVRTERSKTANVRPEATQRKVETRSTERVQTPKKTEQVTERNQQQSRVRTNTDQQRKTGVAERRRETTVTTPENRSGGAERRQETTITRPENSSGSGRTSTRSIGETGNSSDRDFKVNTSSASRVYREGRGTLTRDDGTVVRHQNDEVFASRKYKLDFDNYENLRRSDEFRRDYRDYDDWFHRRRIRIVNHFHNNYIPLPFEMRRSHYYYRVPHHLDLIWTPLLFHRFMFYYPTHNIWDMEFGSPIETISAYEAQQYAGTVRRVYGKVDEVYYSPEDENYILYIGAPFPYQDISIVVPKYIARNISMSPKWYFENEFIWVVGLINMWEGKPEIIVRDEDQIRKY